MPDHINEPEEIQSSATQAEVIVDSDMLTEESMIDRTGASERASGAEVEEWNFPSNTSAEYEANGEETFQEEKNEYRQEEKRDLPPNAKNSGTELVVNQILKGWKFLKSEGGKLLAVIPEKKLDKLQKRGEIDLAMPLKVEGGQIATAGEIIESHNDEAIRVIEENSLSPEFVDEIKPLLIEELNKKGIALTNVQQIMIIAGLDLVSFGRVIKPLFESRLELIAAFKDATQEYKNYNSTNRFNQYQPQPQQSAPAPANNQTSSSDFATKEGSTETGDSSNNASDFVIPHNPGDMVSDIQGSRGGGNPIHSGGLPDFSKEGNMEKIKRKYKKRVSKPRGPYKKK